MARAAMLAWFSDGSAVRGNIDVRMPAPETAGVNGVIAQVRTPVTGAAAANGFHVIGGCFVRQHLRRFFNGAATSAIGFRRRDNAAAVFAELDSSFIPAPSILRDLLSAAMDPSAYELHRGEFAQAWRGRVRKLLLDHGDDRQASRVTHVQ